MRASSVFSLLSLTPLLFAVACGGTDRGGRGYVVIVPRDSSVGTDRGGEESGDSGGEPDPDDSGLADAQGEGHDAGGGFIDAGFPDAERFSDAETFPDAEGFPDAFVPDGGRDAGRPDTGAFDVGFPDLGIPFPPSDAGRPDTGNQDSGTPPAFQTTVSVVTPSQVTMNLQPPVANDPLTFSIELGYDNIGPNNQTISVTNVNINALIVPLQDFQAGPAHNATVGYTTQIVSKVPGSGTQISSPEIFCQLPAGIVTIDLSNGQQLTDIAVITCIQ